jgi:hypothetical protein
MTENLPTDVFAVQAGVETVEMPALPYPPRPERKCGWCGIGLAAVPVPPVPYRVPGTRHNTYFHHGCIARQRNQDLGVPTL